MATRIGSYEVLAELGRGGMGVVLLAHDPNLDRKVAIKMLSPHMAADPELAARFEREARSAAALNHPNIIAIHQIGEDQGQHYFVMEYVEGESLTQLLRREGRLAPASAIQILYQAASGLAAAHRRGIIHRDIKPGNIMLTQDSLVKLADFGIAHYDPFDKKLTMTGQLLGTPGYLSPEVCLGQKQDARSDIFSLGVVLFEMLSGNTPFSAPSPLMALRSVVENPTPDICHINSDVDPELARLLEKMLAKKPEERYQNCESLLADLQGLMDRRVNSHHWLPLKGSGGQQIQVERHQPALIPSQVAIKQQVAAQPIAQGDEATLPTTPLLDAERPTLPTECLQAPGAGDSLPPIPGSVHEAPTAPTIAGPVFPTPAAPEIKTSGKEDPTQVVNLPPLPPPPQSRGAGQGTGAQPKRNEFHADKKLAFRLAIAVALVALLFATGGYFYFRKSDIEQTVAANQNDNPGEGVNEPVTTESESRPDLEVASTVASNVESSPAAESNPLETAASSNPSVAAGATSFEEVDPARTDEAGQVLVDKMTTNKSDESNHPEIKRTKRRKDGNQNQTETLKNPAKTLDAPNNQTKMLESEPEQKLPNRAILVGFGDSSDQDLILDNLAEFLRNQGLEVEIQDPDGWGPRSGDERPLAQLRRAARNSHSLVTIRLEELSSREVRPLGRYDRITRARLVIRSFRKGGASQQWSEELEYGSLNKNRAVEKALMEKKFELLEFLEKP